MGTGWSLTGEWGGEPGHTVAHSQVCWRPPHGSEEYQEVQDWEEDVETHEQTVASQDNQILQQKSRRLGGEIDCPTGHNIGVAQLGNITVTVRRLHRSILNLPSPLSALSTCIAFIFGHLIFQQDLAFFDLRVLFLIFPLVFVA